MDRKWWCEKPQEVLDLWFDNVPITSMENPTANIILINHSKKLKKSKSNMIFLAHNQWDRKLETMHRIIPIIHTQTRLLLTHTFWKKVTCHESMGFESFWIKVLDDQAIPKWNFLQKFKEREVYIPRENEANHWELPVGGGLLEVFLAADAHAATKQVWKNVGKGQKGCCS